MLENFRVQNFRALKDLTIEKTAKINLIVGGNNVGKTSLLEAMYALLAGDAEVQNLHSAFRFDAATVWQSNRAQLFEASGEIDGRMVKRGAPKTGVSNVPRAIAINMAPFKADELATQFGAVAKRNKKDQILKLLKSIDPQTRAIDTLPTQGKNWGIFIGNDSPEMVPLADMGQGFNRLFGLYCRLIASDRKIALIDEVEIGMHRDSLPFLWGALKDASENNDIQIFATTHSRECVQAAVQLFASEPSSLQLIRLEKNDGNIIARCVPHDYVMSALAHDIEVR